MTAKSSQTDGRRDRIAISISRVSVLTRDKNDTGLDHQQQLISFSD